MYDFTFNDAPDRMSAEEIKAMQTKLLVKHLSYSSEHSPWYGKLLGGRRDWTGFTTDDLQSLPLTSKQDLAENTPDFLAVPQKEISDIVFSSGTTGRPCRIAYSHNDMVRLAYNEHRCFAAAGITSEDTVLLTCTLDRCFVAGMAYYLGVRALGAAAVRNGLNTLESHASVIRDLHPTVLVGVPSFLRRLGSFLREQNTDMKCVRRLICIGEPVRDTRLQLTGLGIELQQLWNCPIHSTYASSEIVTSFCECTSQCGGHLIPELAILEIIDENGTVLPPGETGEIVVTPLQTTGMPLIRFRTGDIGFMITERCSCGRAAPRLSPILGRKAQMLKIKGTSLYPRAIYSVLDESPEVDEYYVIATGSGLSDQAEVVVSLKHPENGTAELEDRLRTRCRLHIPVRAENAAEVRNTIYGVSRKPIRFIDRRIKNEPR